MAKTNSVLVTFVNRQGKTVQELCHNPNTCREHAPYIHGKSARAINADVLQLSDEGVSALDAIYNNAGSEEDIFNTKRELALASKDKDIIAELSFDSDPIIRAYVASNPYASKHVLKRLYNDRDVNAHYIWKAVIGNPKAPYSVLSTNALSRDENVKRIMASNPATAGWMLQYMAPRTSDVETLKLIAQHRFAMPSTLDHLAKHEDSTVRSYAAAHRNMKEETLIRLYETDVPVVRAGVAYNPTISDDLALKLAVDVPMVRRGLARNPNRYAFSDDVQSILAIMPSI